MSHSFLPVSYKIVLSTQILRMHAANANHQNETAV